MIRNQTGLILALLALGSAVAGIFILGNLTQRDLAEGQSSPATPGESLYLINCSGCHGVDGSGKFELMGAPALDSSGETWQLSNIEIQELVLKGGEVMPAFEDRLSRVETEQIIQHLQTWWSSDQIETHQGLNTLELDQTD